MKKILLTTPNLVSFRVFLRELAQRLVAENWTVDVACSTTNYPGDYRSEECADIHEIDFPRGANIFRGWRAIRQLQSLVRKIEPDLIHAHIHPAVLATAFARRKDWPITLGTFQGLVFAPLRPGWKRSLYRMVEFRATARMDTVWVLTEDDARAMPLANVRLQKAPGFGANQVRFCPSRFSEEQRRETRRNLGITDEAVVFIFVGRQTVVKGFPETARAAMYVTAKRPDVHFVFVGTSDPRHDDGLDRTERAVLLSDAQIHLLGWHDDIANLLHAADCFVFPSTREGLAVCIMEALSMGLPVVTTDVRGCRELVRDGQTGWIIERDADVIAQQLLRICETPEKRQRLSHNVLAERDRFSRAHFVQEQLEIYQKLLECP